jgi:hypothetical protein
MIGMACGLGLELYLWTATTVPLTWYVAIGTTTTFVIGYGASAFFTPKALGEARA